MRISQRWAFILSLAAFGLALAPALSEANDPSVADLLKRGKEAFAARNYAQAIKLFKSANKASHNSCGPCYLGRRKANRERRKSRSIYSRPPGPGHSPRNEGRRLSSPCPPGSPEA